MALSRELRRVFHAARTYASYRYLTYRKFGRYAPLIPPIALMHDGPADYLEFKRDAEEFFRHYTNLCGLRPNEKMLDVGSGIRRKTSNKFLICALILAASGLMFVIKTSGSSRADDITF